MGYKQIGYLKQIWYIIKHYVSLWFEWQDAKDWAKSIHPGWYQLATQRKRPEIRETYRKKILNAYRGIEYE